MVINMKIKKETAKYILGKAASLILGSFIYGLAINMFLSPGGITMGGFTGISTTLNHLFRACSDGVKAVTV